MFRLRYAPRSFNLSVDKRLATVNPSASIVRVHPVVATAQPLPRLSKQTTFKRYGAISTLNKFFTYSVLLRQIRTLIFRHYNF